MQASHWRSIARRDIEKAREVILEAHPGVLEKSDLAFRRWFVDGYGQALQLAARADTKERAFSALQFYLVGFRDGHLVAWSDRPVLGMPRWAGWTVQRRGSEFRVIHRAAAWKTPVPPLGAKLISCDEQDVLRFLEKRIAPFVDRRTELESTLSSLALRLSNDWMPGALPVTSFAKSCIFESSDASRRAYSLTWESSADGLLALRRDAPEQGLRGWGASRFWIHASNFSLEAQDVESFQKLVVATRELSNAEVVVLDTRGNLGGNSDTGLQLLRALLKGAAPTDASQSRAYWRVSPLAIANLERSLTHQIALGTSDTASLRVLKSVLDAMRSASAAGQPSYVEQDETPLQDGPPETGPPFKGKLIVITDSRCASACLDFTDMVMSVPGAIHAGSPTSADSVYIDVATVSLPSGLRMWVPLKVWRHRTRGNNEPRIPQFVYPGDIDDTASVEAWIASNVLPKIHPIGQ